MGLFSFFDSSLSEKRNLAVLRAVLALFSADTDTNPNRKYCYASFLKTLSTGFGCDVSKAQTMEYVEMASILRKCSDFDKRTHAQTLNAAVQVTSLCPEVRNMQQRLFIDCDFPLNLIK